MRSDRTRDSDGMDGPVMCCKLESYKPTTIDRCRWPHSGKVRQVAVVRPMKTTTTDGTSSTSSSSSAAAAVNLSSQSGISSASVHSNNNLQSNSTNIEGSSRSIVSNGFSVISFSSASSAASAPSSPESPTSSSSSPSASAAIFPQFPDSAPPIGWEFTWSFYYPNLTMFEAKQLLKPHPEGTFLLRNSSEPRYAYSLSVKTNRGTTSVRIQRMTSGRYRLDCDPTQETVIPTFRSVPELIRHYLERNEVEQNGRGNRYVFLESTGRMDTPVLILRPLLKDSSTDRRNNTS